MIRTYLSLPKTRSILYWTTRVFSLSSTMTALVLIYELVTSSASLVRWLTLHYWTSFRLNQSNRVESYVTTDGQSASLSWYQAPIWGLWPDFYYCWTLAGLLIWDALSDERTGLSITIAAVFAKAVILRSESRGAHDHILLSQICDSPNLEGQVPVFISPRNTVARLYPQALDIQLNSESLHLNQPESIITCPPFITPGRTE
jgi:hypothetical protein